MAFAFQRQITLKAGKIPSPQTEFKLRLRISASWLRTVVYGGQIQDSTGPGGTGPGLCDIQFTSDAVGTSIYYWEVESYDPQNGIANVWVKLPTAQTGTTLFIWYSDPTIHTFQSSVPLVWGDDTSFTDPAGYVEVQHFGTYGLAARPFTLAGTTDSTGNASGLAIGTPTQIDGGQIDGGLQLNGSTDAISCIGFSLQNAGSPQVGIEAWFKTSAPNQNGMIVNKSPVNADWALFLEGGNIKLRGANTASDLTYPCPVDGLFHYVVGTISGTSGKIYLDGLLVASGTVTAIANTSDTLEIGRYNSGYYFNGVIDELRIINNLALLTADRILANYNNQFDPDSFYEIGDELVAPTSPAPTVNPWPTLLQGKSFKAYNSGGGNAISTVTLNKRIKVGDLIAIQSSRDGGTISVVDNFGHTYQTAPEPTPVTDLFNCEILWVKSQYAGALTVVVTASAGQLWGAITIWGDDAPICDQGSLAIGFLTDSSKYGIGLQSIYTGNTLLLSILSAEHQRTFSSDTGDTLLTTVDLIVGGGHHSSGIFAKIIQTPSINQIKLRMDTASTAQACAAAFTKPLDRPGGLIQQFAHRPSAGGTPTYVGQDYTETVLPYLPRLGQRLFIGIQQEAPRTSFNYALSDTYGNNYSLVGEYIVGISGAKPIAFFTTTVSHLPSDSSAFKVRCDFVMVAPNRPVAGGISIFEYLKAGSPSFFNLASSTDQGGGFSLAKTQPATIGSNTILLCFASDGAFISSPFPCTWTPAGGFSLLSELKYPQSEAAMSAFANATQLGLSAILLRTPSAGTYEGQVISNNANVEPSIIMLAIPIGAARWVVTES